jgi:hypothetical protein
MDACNWDWGAIAGFTGAVATLSTGAVALYIYNRWRVQKSAEVIANEAKLIINELSKSLKLSEDVFYFFMGSDLNPYELDKSKLYNLITNNIKYQLDTICYLIYINNKGKKDDNLYEAIEAHNQSYYIFNGKLNYANENKEKISNDEINKQIIKAFSDYRDCNLKLKTYLANYALYRKYDKSI